MVEIDNIIVKALAEGFKNTVIDAEKSKALFDFLIIWRKEYKRCIDDVPDGTKEHGP